VGETVKIAVIDDDDSIRDALCNFVSALGYSVEGFASGEDFIASGRLPATSCIIADVQMPGMTGIDLLRELSTEALPAPVILITAFPQDRTRDMVLRNGASGYLAKPLREESLVTCLQQAIGAAR
jgi:FixJ family two-component response regulator